MELNALFLDALKASVKDVVAALSLSSDFSESDLQSGRTNIICSLGVMGKVDGNFSFCFDQKNAAMLVSKMLFMEVEEGSPDVFDGVGELVNMVVGGVKNRFTGTEYNFELSIPMVVQGDDIKVMNKKEAFTRIKKQYICGDIQFGIIADYKVSEKEKVSENEKAEVKMDASARLEEILRKAQQAS